MRSVRKCRKSFLSSHHATNDIKLASTRLVVTDIKGVVEFYEKLTGLTAEWLGPLFAEIVTPAATLAIGSAETIGLFE